MPDDIEIRSTSLASASVSDIVLRETGTTRLVFRSQLVENPSDPQASVHGTFVYQRRRASDCGWEDESHLRLRSLEAGQYVKLDLHAGEVLKLFGELSALYRLHANDGIPLGESTYVRASNLLLQLSGLSQTELRTFLSANEALGGETLARLLQWATDTPDPAALLRRLLTAPDSLNKLTAAAGLASIKAALDAWENLPYTSNEDVWQTLLTDNSFVLEQVFSWPCMIVKDKAYVGGKSVMNQGGHIVDFLYRNQLTRNAALIEIKTRCTPLLGSEYRDGVWAVSGELSGAVVQLLTYRHSLGREYDQLVRDQTDPFLCFSPKCILIIGDTRQLDESSKRQSFELFRSQLADVTVLCFDELLAKTGNLVRLLEAPSGMADPSRTGG